MSNMSQEEMLQKLREMSGTRVRQTRMVPMPQSSSSRSLNNEPTMVEVASVPALNKAKSVSPEARKMREKMSNMDPDQCMELIRNMAVKHIQEQRKKGNIVNGVRGPNFEKHEMQEVNALIYGFKYNHDAPRATQ